MADDFVHNEHKLNIVPIKNIKFIATNLRFFKLYKFKFSDYSLKKNPVLGYNCS